MKIAVVGMGYVGVANAVLMAQRCEVVAFDINVQRVALLNARKSPVHDADITRYLDTEKLELRATADKQEAYLNADWVIIATPTNFDNDSGHFDTTSVEQTIRDVRQMNSRAIIVVKSTVPIGFCDRISTEMQTDNILFSPEFLREGKALHDNLYPSRIVVGGDATTAAAFAEILKCGALKPDVPVMLTSRSEAEAIKLFSNSYLAMRIAYFNELDSYALSAGLDSRKVIEGVCLDQRIGHHYNNPSFGYGGYCLPKDTRQLQSNFASVPQKLIDAAVDSNETRKAFIAQRVLDSKPEIVGVYRLSMKSGSDNFRESSVISVIEHLQSKGVNVIVFEPELASTPFAECTVVNNLEAFKAQSDIILANRWDNRLADVRDVVFTRDLFGSD